ncbi:MAG: YitT family protein [Bacteroidales bacterium]|nr:YitT family protein [Bacteroidales bacterium]
MKPSNFLAVLWDYFLMTVGSVIFCMAWTSFIIPNGLASGGLTGFCTIIQYGTGIPIGISYAVINVILLILGFLVLGKGFGFKTIYVIVLTSILFEVLPNFPQLEVLMDEKLLVALVGCGMESIGIGLVLLRGGSTGGTDIVAMIINKYWPVSPGRVYLFTDIFIITCLLFVPGKGLVDMIYAYVLMLGFSFGVDYVLLGNKSSVQILVFSSKYKEIADHIINEVDRGVTALQSVGWYSQKESKVLLIIARKYQLNEVVNEIKSIDKSAFISVSTAMSVFGEGFEEVKTGFKIKKDNQKIENGQ